MIADLADGSTASWAAAAARPGPCAWGNRGSARRGPLHPIHRGVYAVGHRAADDRGRWMAAVLASGPGAALSHRSAGELWGIVPIGTRGARSHETRTLASSPGDRCPPIAAARRRGRDGRRDPGHLGALARSWTWRRRLRQAELERAMNEVEVRRLTSRSRCRTCWTDIRGGAGRPYSAPAWRTTRAARGSRGMNSRICSRRSSTRTGCLARASMPTSRLAAGSSRSTASGGEQRLIVELDGRGCTAPDAPSSRTASATGCCLSTAGGSFGSPGASCTDHARRPSLCRSAQACCARDAAAPTL